MVLEVLKVFYFSYRKDNKPRRVKHGSYDESSVLCESVNSWSWSVFTVQSFWMVMATGGITASLFWAQSEWAGPYRPASLKSASLSAAGLALLTVTATAFFFFLQPQWRDASSVCRLLLWSASGRCSAWGIKPTGKRVATCTVRPTYLQRQCGAGTLCRLQLRFCLVL